MRQSIFYMHAASVLLECRPSESLRTSTKIACCRCICQHQRLHPVNHQHSPEVCWRRQPVLHLLRLLLLLTTSGRITIAAWLCRQNGATCTRRHGPNQNVRTRCLCLQLQKGVITTPVHCTTSDRGMAEDNSQLYPQTLEKATHNATPNHVSNGNQLVQDHPCHLEQKKEWHGTPPSCRKFRTFLRNFPGAGLIFGNSCLNEWATTAHNQDTVQ